MVQGFKNTEVILWRRELSLIPVCQQLDPKTADMHVRNISVCLGFSLEGTFLLSQRVYSDNKTAVPQKRSKG